jgi:hypothetical protein
MELKVQIMSKGFLNSRIVRYGVVSTIITVLVIVVAFLLNMALTAVFRKYPLNIDLTQGKVFEITQDTKDFLSTLDKDIDIYILNTEDRFIGASPSEYFMQANEVIRKYAQYSSRVKITYLDLLRNPDFGSRYPGLNLSVNDILVTSGERTKMLNSADLFNISNSYYGRYVASSKAEQTLTSALFNITAAGQIRVFVITGHGEEDISPFTELLILNAYEVFPLNLYNQEIPEDTALLILAAPDRDLAELELRKLDAYLESGNGKNLFYLASADQGPLPNIDAFLAEWGIAVRDGLAFEANPALLLSNSVFMSYAGYREEEHSRNTMAKGLLPVFPQSRPLGMVFEQEKYKSVKTLLALSPASGIRPSRAEPDWQPSAADIAGNVPVMILSGSLRNSISGSLDKANVLAAGSVLGLDENILGSSNIANSGYLLDLLGSLTNKEQEIWIESKIIGSGQLGATILQVMIIAAVFMVILPLVILGIGVGVWLKRRHR